jgi:hypothetical protein
MFNHVPPAAIKLWNVSLPIDQHLADTLSKIELTNRADLRLEERLLPLFVGCREEHVHLIVVARPRNGKPWLQPAPCSIFSITHALLAKIHPAGGV